MICVGDFAGQVRGKGVPVAARESRMVSGVGWTPTNVQITCFDTIAQSPFGALGDLVLRPDPSTEVRVELGLGAPVEHFVLADIEHTDGRVWEFCLRSQLKSALADLREEGGLSVLAAFEHEFAFRGEEESGLAFSISGFRKRKHFGELFVAALRRAGISPDTFLREFGTSQYEVTVEPALGVAAADQALIVRELARAVSEALESKMTFTPLPSIQGVGKGVHVHLSFLDLQGSPATYDPSSPSGLSPLAGAFVAGILKYAPDFLALVAPSAISYLRLVPHRWSAAFNNLGYRDREAAVRICPLTAQDEPGKARQANFEFRATDAASNPHLVLATLVRAGLQGIREQLSAPPATEEDLSALSQAELAARGLRRLPATLDEALSLLDAHKVVRSWFPEGFIDLYIAHKRGELIALRDMSQEDVLAAYSRAY